MPDTKPNLSRRGFLGGSGLAIGGSVVLGLGGSTLVSACSASDPSDTPGKPRKGGTLRLALGGASTSDSADSQRATSVWDVGIANQLYNSLFDQNPETGELRPGLATSAEYEGNQKLIITLRDDVEFHHGKTLTSDDVMFSFKRIADKKDPKASALDFTAVDFVRSRVRDPKTIELVLNRPDTFLRARLASSFTTIYPTDWDAANPVGTGPWKFKSFTPGKSITFERFDNYFDTPANADEMTWAAYAEAAALANALTSGAVDLLGNVPSSQIKLLESNRAYQVFRSKSGSSPALAMAKKRAPFTDPRIREAFKLMMDRQAIVSQVFSGEAEIGNDLFNPFDPAYAHELPQREHDPDKAKSLLAQAGVSPLELTLAVANFVPNFEVAIAQSAKSAGVDIKVQNMDQGAFYANHYAQDPLFASIWYTRPIAQLVALNTLPTSPYPETQEDDPRVEQLFTSAASTLEENEQQDHLKAIQRIQWESGGYIIPAHPNQIDAASRKVGGIETDVSGQPFGGYNFKGMWLAS